MEVFDDDACEVEFSGDDGRAYAMLALRTEQLMVLHYSRAEAA